MSLRPVTIEDQTTIRHQFFLDEEDESGEGAILVAAFRGRYRIGCLGAPDATYMSRMTQTAAVLWDAQGVVLDLAELEYEWGDDLEGLVSGGGWITAALAPGEMMMHQLFGASPPPPTPFAVVVGPGCRDAIATLLFGINTTRPATDAEHIFDSLPDAIAYVRGRSR